SVLFECFGVDIVLPERAAHEMAAVLCRAAGRLESACANAELRVRFLYRLRRQRDVCILIMLPVVSEVILRPRADQHFNAFLSHARTVIAIDVEARKFFKTIPLAETQNQPTIRDDVYDGGVLSDA